MYITIDKIAEFLTSKSRVCLTINGHWGIGKTHLWKQVEEKSCLYRSFWQRKL